MAHHFYSVLRVAGDEGPGNQGGSGPLCKGSEVVRGGGDVLHGTFAADMQRASMESLCGRDSASEKVDERRIA